MQLERWVTEVKNPVVAKVRDPRNIDRQSKADARRRKARVVSVRDDGQYISVQYIQDNGEVVSADYKRFGWRQPPREFLAKAWKICATAPETVLHGRPAESPVPPAPAQKPPQP